jgi:hypothetical protein
MTLLRNACAAATILMIAFAIAFLVGTERKVFAQEVPVSGAQIVCEIYEFLVSQGLPIPPNLDIGACDGGGGEEPPTPGTTQCSNFIDDDADGLIDFLPGNPLGDPDCENLADDSESPSSGGGDGGGTGGGDQGGGSGSPGGGGGGGGGAAPLCEDSLDNDGDGLKDMADPGCTDPSDQDETDPNSTGGGGGGSSGGETATTTEPVEASVAAEEVVAAPQCEQYLTAFIRTGLKNDEEQVKRLQSVLISEGAAIEESGIYDADTLAAVHAFQTKYAGEILTPWGMKKSTGYVYLTTRKKVNEIYCKMAKEFPLSVDETGEIEKYRATSISVPTPVRASALPVPETKTTGSKSEKAAEEVINQQVGSVQKESQVAAAPEAERPMSRVWRPIADFLGRIFGR